MITPTIINRLQWKAHLIFTCTNFAFVPLVYFCYPETANLTLEEIDWLFMDGQSPIKDSKRRAKMAKGMRDRVGSSVVRMENGAGTAVEQVGKGGAVGHEIKFQESKW